VTGKNVQLALVDEQGTPVSARGEVRYSHHQTLPFDCGVPEAEPNDIDCVNGVLTLAPAYSPDDTIDIVFKLGDGSWADPYRVQLKVKSDLVGEGDCEQTVYNGTTEPVIVPAEARVTNG